MPILRSRVRFPVVALSFLFDSIDFPMIYMEGVSFLFGIGHRIGVIRFHRHIPDSGTLSINIKSKRELTDTVGVIVYATYSKVLIIDQDNNVTTFI